MNLRYLKYFIFISFYTIVGNMNGQTIWCTSTSTSRNDTEIYTLNLTNCIKKSYCFLPFYQVVDLAIHPNGFIYVIGGNIVPPFVQEIIVLDTCKIVKKIELNNLLPGVGVLSLTADKDGFLYICFNGDRNIYRFDPITELFTSLGSLPENLSVVDLTFRTGKLYATAVNSTSLRIVEVNLLDLNQSKSLFIDLVDNRYYAKLITIPDMNDCSKSVTYISGWFDNNVGLIKGILSFDDGSVTQVCIDAGNGMASSLEFLASDPECDLLFDLDRDNSSGVFPYDYRNETIACATAKTASIVDTDVYLHTTAPLDSIVISISGAQDGAAEVLTLSAGLPDAFLLSHSGKYILTLTGSDRSDGAWLKALKAIRYTNSRPTATPGLRTITLTAHNAIKSNSAKAYIQMEQPPYAGKDTTITMCHKKTITGVLQILGGQSGGVWLPPFASQDTYHPDLDQPRTYRYITQNVCGRDTALFTVITAPSRTLDLGPNISLCRSESHTITLPTQGGDQIRWSDGSSQTSRVITGPGTYAATITTTEGCAISNTITITRSYTKIPQSKTISLCDGETYTYKGVYYSAGQTISDSIPAQTGCDTLLSLRLDRRATPAIFRDTMTCTNAPITIQNQTYIPGDTIIRFKPAITGCDTVVHGISYTSGSTAHCVGHR
ncbi:MAG: hypothetical protein IPJ13_06595 [Saprospiraceae bacterium]|nr:hypothetical protein [Saprospiraceae bacterium]